MISFSNSDENLINTLELMDFIITFHKGKIVCLFSSQEKPQATESGAFINI